MDARNMKAKQCSYPDCTYIGTLWQSKPQLCKTHAMMLKSQDKPTSTEINEAQDKINKFKKRTRSEKVYSTSTSQYKPVERSIPELVKLASITFNRWIKQRDTAGVGGNCISCGTWYPTRELQSGHYMPSTYTILKFNENNVNIECEKCNCSDTNHLKFYRINLIKKIGLEKVLELESTHLATYHKWEREELYDIINTYK